VFMAYSPIRFFSWFFSFLPLPHFTRSWPPGSWLNPVRDKGNENPGDSPWYQQVPFMAGTFRTVPRSNPRVFSPRINPGIFRAFPLPGLDNRGRRAKNVAGLKRRCRRMPDHLRLQRWIPMIRPVRPGYRRYRYEDSRLPFPFNGILHRRCPASFGPRAPSPQPAVPGRGEICRQAP